MAVEINGGPAGRGFAAFRVEGELGLDDFAEAVIFLLVGHGEPGHVAVYATGPFSLPVGVMYRPNGMQPAIVILLESGVRWEQEETGEDWKSWWLEPMLRREIKPGQCLAARVDGVSCSGQSGLTFFKSGVADFQSPHHEIH